MILRSSDKKYYFNFANNVMQLNSDNQIILIMHFRNKDKMQQCKFKSKVTKHMDIYVNMYKVKSQRLVDKWKVKF